MPLQDLTPQLRTRLTRVERSVGWFIFIATALLVFGFAYYLYHAAVRKGWFLVNAKFFAYVNKGDGLNVGDQVVLMGFPVGQITGIAAMPPRTGHNVRIDFVINKLNQDGTPYFNYVWTEGSRVRINSDFLGKRVLEVVRGASGFNVYSMRPVHNFTLEELQSLPDNPTNWWLAQNIYDENFKLVFRAFTNLTHVAEMKPESNWWLAQNIYDENSNLVSRAFTNLTHNPITISALHKTQIPQRRHIAAMWSTNLQCYVKYNETNAYELATEETPAVSDQLQAMVTQVQQALPNVLALTNQLAAVLNNAANATSNLNLTIAAVHPLVENFAAISGDLHGPGTLGAWVLGTNASYQLENALTNVNSLLVNVDTNLNQLTDQIGLSLENLAGITSNLNVQVQANSNLLWGISKTVMDSDSFIQGLKHHWLLRSAFKRPATNQPALKNPPPTKAK